jgi:hypothetical protein
MADMPTPAAVPAGHVVRVRIPHQTYTSPVLSPANAKTELDRVTQAVQNAGTGAGLFQFDTNDGRSTWVRGRSVLAVEVGPPPPARDQQAPVAVHLHLYGDDAQEAAESAAGLFPTPMALAGRRQQR